MNTELKCQIIDVCETDSEIQLHAVTKKGKKGIIIAKKKPYFFIEFEGDLKKNLDIVKKIEFTDKELFKVVDAEIVRKKIKGELKDLIKVEVNNDKASKILSPLFKTIKGFLNTYEKQVRDYKKFLFDNKIVPLTNITIIGKELELNNNYDFIIEFEKLINEDDSDFDYKILTFDIETYNPEGLSEVQKDPVLMISYSIGNKAEVLTYKKNTRSFARTFSSEKEMLEEFIKVIKKENPDFIITYNGDNFDLPYLRERCKINRVKPYFGIDDSNIKFSKGGVRGTIGRITGRVHLDLYPFISTTMGTYLKTDSFTLYNVCNELLEETKTDYDVADLYSAWEENRIDEPLEYSLQDAVVTQKLSKKIIPLIFELTRIVGINPFEICRMGYSRLVENYLMKETRNFNEIILRKPSREELSQRFKQTFKGGFVYEPKPGFYENIAVFDFRSLYPSIIIAHNVCLTTIDAKGKDVHESPKIMINNEEKSFKFRKHPRGFIPTLIKGLIEKRAEIKKEIKNSSKDHAFLSAKQNAIKILANATYGYLGFPQSRWYSLECAASITAWGRKYINDVIRMAEIQGLKVLYGDTDSCFFILKDNNPEKVKEFVKKVNANLPEMMVLNFEGLFKTGIFVSKKSETKGAKKKYALARQDDTLEIKGFEFVRRDWAMVAKELQEKILKQILIKKDFKKALTILKKTITDIRNKKIPIEKFVIKTRMTKEIKDYGNIGPHVSAAMKAQNSGKVIRPGMLISYVIIKGKGKISERSFTEDEVIEKDLIPDPEYYINNQIIPSIEEIMKVVGFKEEDFAEKEQKTLKGFL